MKDIAPAGQNEDEDGWADVGAGVLDWPDLWRACREAGAEWMVVEHDKPADPARTARASFDYLSDHRGVTIMRHPERRRSSAAAISSGIYLQNIPLYPRSRRCGPAPTSDPRWRKPRRSATASRRAPSTAAASDDIDLVVNLTIPSAHFGVSLAALDRRQARLSEKPLARRLRAGPHGWWTRRSARASLGCAPDTFLGAGGRLARKIVDDGRDRPNSVRHAPS